MANYFEIDFLTYTLLGWDKRENVGFAKIENRKDQDVSRSACAMCVCREPGYRRLSDVHRRRKAFFRQDVYPRRAGEFRCMVQMDNGMPDCYGLTIHSIGDSWQSYTTIWEAMRLPMLLRWICQMPFPKNGAERNGADLQEIRFQNSQPQETGLPEVGSRDH